MISEHMEKLFITIPHDKYEDFLAANSWNLDYTAERKYSVWHDRKNGKTDFELVIPYETQNRDYNYLIMKSANKLCDYYECDATKLLHKLRNEIKDLVKIRIVHDDVVDGMIPLEDGVKLVESAKELMTSSALSTISKRPIFFGKQPELVNKFLGHLRLGQTEIGSYIINVYSIIKMKDYDELEPFSRKVSSQLVDSITTLKEVIKDFRKNEKTDVFDKAVENGVSGNLCSAIMKLSGSGQARNVIIKLNIEKEIIRKDELHEFHIPSSDIPIINEAYTHYLSNNYIENYELEGYVIKLSRDELSQSGDIWVSTLIYDKQRVIKAYLNASQYDIAIAAHKAQQKVIIIGDLRIELRRAEIINITNIYIGSE